MVSCMININDWTKLDTYGSSWVNEKDGVKKSANDYNVMFVDTSKLPERLEIKMFQITKY